MTGFSPPDLQGHVSSLALLLVDKKNLLQKTEKLCIWAVKQGGVSPRFCGPRVSHAAVSVNAASICFFPPSLGCRHIRVYLPPLDSSTPNTYCSKALELQAPLVFNEVFRIPVHSSMVTLKSLQLYVCSVNPQLQEELLVWLIPASSSSLPACLSPVVGL